MIKRVRIDVVDRDTLDGTAKSQVIALTVELRTVFDGFAIVARTIGNIDHAIPGVTRWRVDLVEVNGLRPGYVEANQQRLKEHLAPLIEKEVGRGIAGNWVDRIMEKAS